METAIQELTLRLRRASPSTSPKALQILTTLESTSLQLLGGKHSSAAWTCSSLISPHSPCQAGARCNSVIAAHDNLPPDALRKWRLWGGLRCGSGPRPSLRVVIRVNENAKLWPRPFVAYSPEDLEQCMKQQLTSEDATNLLARCVNSALTPEDAGRDALHPGELSSVGSLLAPMSSQVAFADTSRVANKPRS